MKTEPTTKTEAKTVWAIYVRVSTHQQTAGTSLAEQRRTLSEYAATNGWEYRVYEDAGVSGETLDRPALMALLADADRGDLSGILIVDESRLGRSSNVSMAIRTRLERAGLPIAIPGRPLLDLQDESMMFIAEVLASTASLEQKMRTKKTRAGLRRTAQDGHWPGGPAPYGYELVRQGAHTDLAIKEDEAAVLRLAADLILRHGHTTYSAAAQLSARGILTRHGSRWTHPNLAAQLRNQRTTGLFMYESIDGRIAIDIPPIFDRTAWESLQKAIRGKPRGGRENRVYPLTGRGRNHLRCACGGNFYGYRDTSRKHKVVYECNRNDHALGEDRCPHLPRVTPAEVIEHAVWDRIAGLLSNHDLLAELAGAYVARSDEAVPDVAPGLERRLGLLHAEETRLVRQLASSDRHAEAVERALGEVADERVTIEKELNRIREHQETNLGGDRLTRSVERLVDLATARLSEPTPERMVEIVDLCDVDLLRTEGRTFEGVARIPLPDPGTAGEVWEEAPLRPSPRPRRSGLVADGEPLERGRAT